MDEKTLGEEIKAELHREVENLRYELHQIRNLVKDAIIKLTQSFEGLREQSNTQMGLVSTLISTMETTGRDEENERINIRQFVSETDQILRSFVDHIIMVSRQSMEMVHRIDDLAEQMRQVVVLVKDVKTIADQTNVLALNARIVAARAGQAGAAFSVVADEVRKLSKNSNKFSDQIGAVVSKAQTNIDTAKNIIETMASKDMSFAIQSKSRVDEMMEEISDIDRYTSQTLSEVSQLTTAITHSVGIAVMSLQFEDMVSQLAENMDRKFAMLENFSESLCCGCLNMQTGSMDERMRAVRNRLEDQRTRFDDADRKAVHQVTMDEGDIELF